jgi:hypothetical protein
MCGFTSRIFAERPSMDASSVVTVK